MATKLSLHLYKEFLNNKKSKKISFMVDIKPLEYLKGTGVLLLKQRTKIHR